MSSPFPKTSWTQVLSLKSDAPAAAQAALDYLCRAYWQPLYLFAKQSGKSHQDAEDMVQSFIQEAIQRKTFESAEPEKGRLRSYLLAAFRHFLANEYNAAQRLKRGGGVEHVSLDHAACEIGSDPALTDNTTPETEFNRNWARTVLSAAKERLRQEFEEGGKSELFALLVLELEGEACPAAGIAKQTGMTVSAIDTAKCRLRSRYRVIVREEVANTIKNPTAKEIDAELRELVRTLNGLGSMI